MSLFKDERELISKLLSPKLKELNYHVRVGVRLRGKHQKLKTEDSLSNAELDIQHSLSPDIDILYWEKDYLTEPYLHAVEVKYYRYDKKTQLHPPMYDGIGEAIILGTFGVDYVHLWHFFDPEVSDEEYNNHKQVLETALNEISMINYDCTRLTMVDKKIRNGTEHSDTLLALRYFNAYFLDKQKSHSYSENSLRYDDNAKIIRNIIKKAYRIV